MIEKWMLSVIVLGAIIGIGGTFLGQIVPRLGLPRRWLWLALMVTSVALPVALAMRPTTPTPAQTQSVQSAESVAQSKEISPAPIAAAPVSDATLLIGWALLSACLAGLFLATHRRTLAQLAAWKTRDVMGHPVTISPDFGPAAVGFVRTRVVLPEWALDLPAEEQRLVLRHEQQHIASGDHFVLLAGVLMLVIMPWNLGLWWQLRRLRVGMELDCDARVAPSLRDRPRYAQLLLRSREHRQARSLALAMAPAPSALGERLLALLDRTRPSPRQMTAWSIAAVACVGLVMRIQVPNLTPLLASASKVAITDLPPARGVLANPPPALPATRPVSAGGTRRRQTPPTGSSPQLTEPRPRYDILIPYVQGPVTVARGGGRGSFGPGTATRAYPPGVAALTVKTPPDSTQHLK